MPFFAVCGPPHKNEKRNNILPMIFRQQQLYTKSHHHSSRSSSFHRNIWILAMWFSPRNKSFRVQNASFIFTGNKIKCTVLTYIHVSLEGNARRDEEVSLLASDYHRDTRSNKMLCWIYLNTRLFAWTHWLAYGQKNSIINMNSRNTRTFEFSRLVVYKCVAKPNRPNLSNATTLGSDLDLDVVLFSANEQKTHFGTQLPGRYFHWNNTTWHYSTQSVPT